MAARKIGIIGDGNVSALARELKRVGHEVRTKGKDKSAVRQTALSALSPQHKRERHMWSKLCITLMVVACGFDQISPAVAAGNRDAEGQRAYGAADDHDQGNHYGEIEHGKAPKGQPIQALFGLDNMTDGPFPADRFTVVDETQNTCKRVNMPRGDCTGAAPEQPSSCVEVDQLNNFDGFNIKPRITIPFSGPIDLSTVNSATIFLVSLGDALVDGAPGCLVTSFEDEDHDGDELLPPADAGWVVGINQAVWDPLTNTLFVEADEILDQHSRYAVIITSNVKDENGFSIETTKAFKKAIGDDDDDADDGVVVDPDVAAYKQALRGAIHEARFFGVRRKDVVAASVFTTMSVSAVIEKIRDQVLAAPAPAAADFKLGPSGARTLFTLSSITSLTFNRQLKTTGALSPQSLAARLTTLRAIPSVGQLAWGRYQSPNYLTAERLIPSTGTFSGVPEVLNYETVYFNIVIPAGAAPANGWPVIIYGQGTGDNLNGAPFNVAANFANHGFATVAINFPGQGLGPTGTLTVARTGNPAITFPAGGRAVDVNHDDNFDSPEGWNAPPPKSLQLSRNASRQAAIDIMQLIRVLEVGVDVDGNGTTDLDAGRIYYSGISAGSAVGALLVAVDSRLRGAVMSGIGGWPYLHLEPVARPVVGANFAKHFPPLLNPPGTPLITSIGGVGVAGPFFNENVPDRDQPPLVNTIAGALPLQEWIERLEWLSETGAAGAFSVYWRLKPLAGVAPRPFIIQMSRGDQQALNPITAALARASLVADRITLYRHDLFANRNLFKDPHSLVIRTDNAVMSTLAAKAQEQISTFFASDGTVTTDPDGADVLFETPASFIPSDYGFIP
jgi:hypothetical protein